MIPATARQPRIRPIVAGALSMAASVALAEVTVDTVEVGTTISQETSAASPGTGPVLLASPLFVVLDLTLASGRAPVAGRLSGVDPMASDAAAPLASDEGASDTGGVYDEDQVPAAASQICSSVSAGPARL